MCTLAVNEQYPLSVPVESARAEFLRDSGNILLIALAGISDYEANALRRGPMRCGLLAKNGAILFLWQFRDESGKLVFTLDSQFDARIIPDIALHNIENSGQRLMIDVHIVDIDTGLLRGLRDITMPPGLTVKFLSAVQDQLTTHETGKEQIQRWMGEEPYTLAEQTKMWLMGE